MKIEMELTKEMVLAAQRVLADNGIEMDETAIVMEALGAVLFDADLDNLIEYDADKIPYNNSVWDK